MARLRHDRQESRKKQALQRNEAWAKLTPAQKLKALDARLGKGVGAKKQRKKLAATV